MSMSLDQPSAQTLRLFKAQLWKDQRNLATAESSSGRVLIKSFPSEEEATREARILRILADEIGPEGFPIVHEVVGSAVTYSYVKGVRVFNLLVELDRLPPRLDALGRSMKKLLIERCEARQRLIQASLKSRCSSEIELPYPVLGKVLPLIELLADCLGIGVRREAIHSELANVESMWTPEAVFPFRDATTKNMVLAYDALWLGSFGGDESARRAMIIQDLERMLSAGAVPEWSNARLVDFDFASCTEGSAPEDDTLSLKYHERTWMGPPASPSDVLWANIPPNGRRAAIAFLVRYYRFGGRKAAYRLLHPKGHRIRFRYDSDVFYFERLSHIVRHLWPESDTHLAETLAFTEAASRCLGYTRPAVDHFVAAGLAEQRRYYVDMYPE